MADPHWTSYVGMATGIIGAFSGVIGYRKASKLKSLDLRLELRKEINKAHRNTQKLEELIRSADKSRIAISAARGVLKSSMTEKWKASIAIDQNAIQNIKESIPNSETNFINLSQLKLETKLIEIHKTNGELSSLIDKYISEMEKDDENRRGLQEDRRARN